MTACLVRRQRGNSLSEKKATIDRGERQRDHAMYQTLIPLRGRRKWRLKGQEIRARLTGARGGVVEASARIGKKDDESLLLKTRPRCLRGETRQVDEEKTAPRKGGEKLQTGLWWAVKKVDRSGEGDFSGEFTAVKGMGRFGVLGLHRSWGG